MAQLRHVNYTLKPTSIEAAKPKEKAYSLTDGGGLILEVLPGGSKVWRFKYHHLGKREKVTIGLYPSWSIKDARNEHERLREQLHKGESPAKAKQSQKAERLAAEARAVTFKAFAQEWVEEKLMHLSEAYRAKTIGWLDSDIYPAIGRLPLGEVTAHHILDLIEGRKATPVTADRLRAVVQQIFAFAVIKRRVTSNPAAGLVGAVKVPPVRHHTHLTELQVGAFWRTVDVQGAHASTVLATKLLALTMVRKMELLRAKKTEFDLEAAIWDVPAERMKMRRPHRVYLSRQAVELLQQLFHFTQGSPYLVPSIHRNTTHMAEATLNHFFKRMDIGVEDFSPHGLRGTAATMLREAGFGKDVVELLLAHAERDKTVAAYSHHELPEERRRALQWLADRIELLAYGAKVVPIAA
jgi:integrase